MQHAIRHSVRDARRRRTLSLDGENSKPSGESHKRDGSPGFWYWTRGLVGVRRHGGDLHGRAKSWAKLQGGTRTTLVQRQADCTTSRGYFWFSIGGGMTMSSIEIAANNNSSATIDRETIDALRAELRGCLLLPTDQDYDEARRVWNGKTKRCRGRYVA